MKYLLLVVMLAPIGLLTYRGIVINKREYSKLTRDVVRLHIVAATSLLVYALTMLAANVFFAKTVYGIYFRKLRRNFDFIFERKMVRGSILIR